MKFLSKLSKEHLVCSELQVKDYKNILKCSYGDDIDFFIFAETLCDICSSLTNKHSSYFKKLNIIDLFCLILDIRINSQGNVCNVVITKEDKTMNLELNLDHIRNEIKALEEHLFAAFEHNNIKITFECPSVERLLEKTNGDYLSFIKSAHIKDGDTERSMEITSNEQAELLLDKISPKISIQIINKFNQFVESVTGMNFLSRYGIKDQTLAFIPSLESLVWFVKLMFNEPLETFYDNIFYLAHVGHLNAEYVESVVVGEYNYFVSCLRKTLADKSRQTNSTQSDGSF